MTGGGRQDLSSARLHQACLWVPYLSQTLACTLAQTLAQTLSHTGQIPDFLMMQELARGHGLSFVEIAMIPGIRVWCLVDQQIGMALIEGLIYRWAEPLEAPALSYSHFSHSSSISIKDEVAASAVTLGGAPQLAGVMIGCTGWSNRISRRKVDDMLICVNGYMLHGITVIKPLPLIGLILQVNGGDCKEAYGFGAGHSLRP
ncbi:hypothetical protein DFH29DRAFT_877021 [Suillus ampliporus]|nr:hypothetical protein DFH29DRAFT_877021 [Suillus ampliporus]